MLRKSTANSLTKEAKKTRVIVKISKILSVKGLVSCWQIMDCAIYVPLDQVVNENKIIWWEFSVWNLKWLFFRTLRLHPKTDRAQIRQRDYSLPVPCRDFPFSCHLYLFNLLMMSRVLFLFAFFIFSSFVLLFTSISNSSFSLLKATDMVLSHSRFSTYWWEK